MKNQILFLQLDKNKFFFLKKSLLPKIDGQHLVKYVINGIIQMLIIMEKKGETIANSFRKNAHSKESCYSWAATNTKRLQPNEKNKVVAIAFINTVLFDVVEMIKPKFLYELENHKL